MAVAFDAKATAADVQNPFAATNTINFMTVGATGTALVVFVAIATSGANTTLTTATGATWNGVTMSLIGSKVQSDGLASVYAFGLASPTTGAHPVVITCSGGTLADNSGYVDAVSFSGTATTTAAAFPSANVKTDASTPTGTSYPTTAFSITTTNGDAVCAGMNCQINQFSTTTGTLIHTDGAVNGNYTGAYKLATTSATTIQFTGGGSGSPAAGVAFDVAQPSAASTPVIPHDFTPAFAKRQLPLDVYRFHGFTALAPEDTVKYEWTNLWEGPVWPKKGLNPAQQQFLAELLGFTPVRIPWFDPLADPIRLVPREAYFESLAFVSVVTQSGTGNMLWYQPLSGVMILNTIGSD